MIQPSRGSGYGRRTLSGPGANNRQRSTGRHGARRHGRRRRGRQDRGDQHRGQLRQQERDGDQRRIRHPHPVPGEYRIRVTAPGFTEVVREGMPLRSADVPRADIDFFEVAAVTDGVTAIGSASLRSTGNGESLEGLPPEVPVSGAVARQHPGNGLRGEPAERGCATGTGTSPSARPGSEDRASFMRPGRRPACTGGGCLPPRAGSSRKSTSSASASMPTTCRRSGLIWPPRIQHII